MEQYMSGNELDSNKKDIYYLESFLAWLQLTFTHPGLYLAHVWAFV